MSASVIPNRCFRDRTDNDAEWVAVQAPTYDEAMGPEAKAAAIRYLSEKTGGAEVAIELHHGPAQDTGETNPVVDRLTTPHQGDEYSNQALTADQYRHLAAVQEIHAGKNVPYLCFFKVRRLNAIGT